MVDLGGGQEFLRDREMNGALTDWLRCKQAALKMLSMEGHAPSYRCFFERMTVSTCLFEKRLSIPYALYLPI
jgi:hypothetical protein